MNIHDMARRQLVGDLQRLLEPLDIYLVNETMAGLKEIKIDRHSFEQIMGIVGVNEFIIDLPSGPCLIKSSAS